MIEPLQQPAAAQQTTQSAPAAMFIKGVKYRWLMPHVDTERVRNIAYTHSLAMPIAHVLYSRGFLHDDHISSFLFTSYERDVPHASSMKGLLIAAERIIAAKANNEKILIFGDYDVDGVTSSSLALTALLPLGVLRELDGGLSEEGGQRDV